MKVMDPTVDIVGSVAGICNANMVPAGMVRRLTIRTILTGQALPHLPSSQHRKELRLPIGRHGRIAVVGKNTGLERVRDSMRIICDELSSLLVMDLTECRKSFDGVSKSVECSLRRRSHYFFSSIILRTNSALMDS